MTSQSLLAQSWYHRVCSWLQGLFINTKLAHRLDIAKLAYLELLSQSLFMITTIAYYYKTCSQVWHRKACLLRALFHIITIAYYYKACSQAWLCSELLSLSFLIITELVHITTNLAHKRDFAKLACSEVLVVIREGVAWWASQCRHVLANSVSPVQINPYNNPQENQSISRWKSFADRIHSTRCNSMSPVQINPYNNPEEN